MSAVSQHTACCSRRTAPSYWVGQCFELGEQNPAEAKSLRSCLECELARCLVDQAGLVLMGKKPAAIFQFTPREAQRFCGCCEHKQCVLTQETTPLLSYYRRCFMRFGLRISWLAQNSSRVSLLVWRPREIAQLLRDEALRSFLLECALLDEKYLLVEQMDVSEQLKASEKLIQRLIRRLRLYYQFKDQQHVFAELKGDISATQAWMRPSFPHEIGVILGYPLEDVQGFIAARSSFSAKQKLCGFWKVYSNPERAMTRFQELSKAEHHLKGLYREGVSMRDLLHMGLAYAS